MNKQQALDLLFAQIPPTGEVNYEAVETELRKSRDGVDALEFFHSFRRAGVINARINREDGSYFVSRAQGASNE